MTVIGAECPHNINDHESLSAEGILTTIAGTMATPASNDVYYDGAAGGRDGSRAREDGRRRRLSAKPTPSASCRSTRSCRSASSRRKTSSAASA